MYPLRFEPNFRRYLWGGRRLGTTLHKNIGPESDYAESWEIVDRESDNSIVLAGACRGQTLGALIDSFGARLLGTQVYRNVCQESLPAPLQSRFPLLFKYLDANRTLSVQVHPDDEIGARLVPPDLGKTEAWYVLDAQPGSVVYAGLQSGVDRNRLSRAVASGTTDEVLHRIYPQPGDCIFIPAGTVHAIGEGLLIAEIQQSSDTTYRLFDWDRVDARGNPRQLHVDQAIAVTDYERGPVSVQTPRATGQAGIDELVACDKFVLNCWNLKKEKRHLATNDRFRLLSVVAGEMSIAGDPAGQPLSLGQTALIPAALGSVALTVGDTCQFLEISVPD